MVRHGTHHVDGIPVPSGPFEAWEARNRAERRLETAKKILLWLTAFALGLVLWVFLFQAFAHAVNRADLPPACDNLTAAECIAYHQEAAR